MATGGCPPALAPSESRERGRDDAARRMIGSFICSGDVGLPTAPPSTLSGVREDEARRAARRASAAAEKGSGACGVTGGDPRIEPPAAEPSPTSSSDSSIISSVASSEPSPSSSSSSSSPSVSALGSSSSSSSSRPAASASTWTRSLAAAAARRGVRSPALAAAACSWTRVSSSSGSEASGGGGAGAAGVVFRFLGFGSAFGVCGFGREAAAPSLAFFGLAPSGCVSASRLRIHLRSCERGAGGGEHPGQANIFLGAR